MPPTRNPPPHRAKKRVDQLDSINTATVATTRPSAIRKKPPPTDIEHDWNLVWNGRYVTYATRFLLLEGEDIAQFHFFRPTDVLTTSFVLDPTSGLPLPPRPNNVVSEMVPAGVASSESTAASSSSSTSTPSVAHHTLPNGSPSTRPSSLASTPASDVPTTTSQDEQQPGRPSNAWMLFRSDFFNRSQSLDLPRHSEDPKSAWLHAPETVKDYYRELARLTKVVHTRLHPDYKYKPRTKAEKQRDQEEKQRLREEKALAKKALGGGKRKHKTKPPTSDGTTTAKKPSPKHPRPPPPPPRPAAVDVRMYEPHQQKYYPPSAFGSRGRASSSSSAPPLPPRINNSADGQVVYPEDKSHLPPVDSTTVANEYHADDSDLTTIWPSIEQGVAWSNAVGDTGEGQQEQEQIPQDYFDAGEFYISIPNDNVGADGDLVATLSLDPSGSDPILPYHIPDGSVDPLHVPMSVTFASDAMQTFLGQMNADGANGGGGMAPQATFWSETVFASAGADQPPISDNFSYDPTPQGFMSALGVEPTWQTEWAPNQQQQYDQQISQHFGSGPVYPHFTPDATAPPTIYHASETYADPNVILSHNGGAPSYSTQQTAYVDPTYYSGQQEQYHPPPPTYDEASSSSYGSSSDYPPPPAVPLASRPNIKPAVGHSMPPTYA